MTTTLRIEHAISDYDTWKVAFDRDPANRKQSGVRHYSIYRPVNDANYVIVDLDFDSVRDADALLTKLQEIWKSPAAAPALGGQPMTRILDTVESTAV